MIKQKLFTLVLFAISASAFSQQSAPAPLTFSEDYLLENDTVKKRGQVLQEVIIRTEQQQPASAVRSGIAPMDLPQSLQVIDNEVIRQQQSIRLSDVVKNANGVYVGSARGGAQESFFSRGYDMSANNMFKNGFRFSSGSMPEVSSLEKVEVLKGSAALLYGNVAPGGILNMVTKTPLFKHGGEMAMQIGSYSFYKPSVDVYGPLNSSIAYRFNGSYENSESFRDVVKNERYYLNPSFLFKVGPRTQIILQGDYLDYDWTPDFGTGIIGKEIVDLPRNLYLGARWSNGHTTQSSISTLLTHEFNNNWKLNFNSSIQNYNRRSKGTERIQPAANGDWSRPLGQSENDEQILGEQISIQGIFHTGKIKHQLFTGVDYENSRTTADAYTFNPNTYGSGNIFDFENFDQGTGIPTGIKSRITKTETDRFGIYAQDLISLSRQFKVLAGLRWSWQEAQVDTNNRVADEDNPGEFVFELTKGPKEINAAFSPKVGLVYQPTKQMSLFASYATSFTPNSGTTVSGDALEPSIIDQFEIGVKKEYLNGLLSTNLTLYQIVNSNLAQTAEFKADGTPNTDTSIKVLSGETTSKGIELDILAKPVVGLNIIAGYSYNDMRYTDTAKTNGSFIEGDRVVRTPAHTANLSFFYTLQTGLLKGLSIGALGNYIGDRVGGWNNQVVIDPDTGESSVNDREIPLDGYTTIDVSAGYTWKKFSILCRLSNVANVLNYTVHENYSVNPIAPRQLMTSLRYTF
ncbi:MAG TPA: TonB-dependent siderophore receptor [Flavobacterium sp.]|jgi:iron complex outermembrane receptor protein